MQPPDPPNAPLLSSRDRRARLRFDMNLPVLIRALGECSSVGKLSNISVQGAYILTGNPFLLNARADYVLELPPELTKAAQPRMIQFIGVVLRCERTQARDFPFGIAFESLSCRYLPAAEVARLRVLWDQVSATHEQTPVDEMSHSEK
jgi:hypothetical protein